MTLVEEKVDTLEKEEDIILSVRNLKTYFPIFGGLFKRVVGVVKAVDGVSFDLHMNETIGLVGESGCGKTTIGNTILNLVEPESGEIYFKNQRLIKPKNFVSNMLKKKGESDSVGDLQYTKKFRKKIQMVFQDPDSSLNPRWKIVDIIGEPLKILEGIKKKRDIRRRVLELLETVSMKAEHLDRYPHEFSGGQKQRIVIARALASNPEIIILDEPTSALDVSVQAQILNLLKDLQKRFGLSYLFITHDLSVIQHIADTIQVMYLGKFVEGGTINEVFYNPVHPYTKALLSARPTFDPDSKAKRIILKGDVPSPINPPSGCNFHPRCYEREDHVECDINQPERVDLGGKHYIVCNPLRNEKKDI
ncbi:MAG: ABC transporter ATP-binding protein [Promethearchaeota archaeon]